MSGYEYMQWVQLINVIEPHEAEQRKQQQQ